MLVAQKNYEYAYEQYNTTYQRPKKTVGGSKPKKNKKIAKGFRMMISISVLFVIGFIIVLRFASLTEMANTLDKQKKEISSLEKTNSQLATETTIDLKTVDNIAKTKLGMDKPYKYQIVYVDLNENNKQVAAGAAKDEGEFKIAKKLSKVVEYLY